MSKPVCESHEMCPLMNKKRILVCHKCAWYNHIRGSHPQTGEDMDHWECAVAMLPMLLIENGRQINTTNAALGSLRNDFVEGNVKRIANDIVRTQALIRAQRS